MSKISALVGTLLIIASPAAAQTAPGQSSAPPASESSAPAQSATGETLGAREALHQACAADAANLCKDVEPGRGAIFKCLKDHRDAVSDGCKSAWRNLRATRQGRTQGG